MVKHPAQIAKQKTAVATSGGGGVGGRGANY